MSDLSSLIIRSENLIKEFNFNITTNNLDTQSGYGDMKGVLTRISIFYRTNTVVFTYIPSNYQIIMKA